MASPQVPAAQERRRFTLRTLGTASLYSAGSAEPALGPGKPLALLVYLALTPGRRTSREFLLDLLWADLDPDRARSALRQVLFHLRRLLGEDALPGSEEVTLALPIETDRDAFLGAIERGELEAAAGAYGGVFLPAFGVPGGAAFEQWADLERNRLRAAYLSTVEILVRRLLNQSRFREAQRLARRARDEVPGSEAAWRLLLEAVVAGRDFVAAAVEAEALERWAASEAVLLEPATRAAIAGARQVVPTPEGADGQGTLLAELTGREREFSAIVAAWESVRAGAARHIHLTAPPGLGKTRLLRDAVARLRAVGVRVAEVRAAPGDRDIPYAFAGDLAATLAALPGARGIAPASAAALIGLNPMLSAILAGSGDTAVGDEAARRRIQALTDLVQAVAHEGPFVLVIDDLHWVDAASYRLLEGLWGRLGSSRVLCLSASRPERRPASEDLVVLPLAPLSSAQVGSLVSALGAIPDGASWAVTFVTGLHAATGGSPLLVLETLQLALGDGILELDERGWRCGDEAGLAALLRAGEAVRQRVRSLPPEEGWALALLATAGTPLAIEELAAAARAPAVELAEVLRTLERQGLAARAGEGWQPAHDEIAVATREALGPRQRVEADASIGRLLGDSAGSDTHRLLRALRHLAEAGDTTLVREYFRRYARMARGQEDRRPFHELAAVALGVERGSPRALALARELPWPWRLGLWNSARVAAAILLLAAAVAGAIGGTRLMAKRSAGRQRLFYADSTGATSMVSVTPADFDGRDTPLVSRGGTPSFAPQAITHPELPPSQSPDGRSVAWNQDSGDSTTIDIWIRTPGGTRRLTREFRDDLVSEWLPDGSALVGATNRWSSLETGGYDIAVFDTATGAARPVTHGPDHDGTATVSPDGTRIAFIRETEDRPPRVCVVPIDGLGEPECRMPGGSIVAELSGWSSPTELILTMDEGATRPLIRYDWDREERALLFGPHAYRPRISPDRKWVVVSVRVNGVRGFRDWIVPVDRPAAARQVGAPGGAGASIRWWEGARDPAGLVDRIALADTGRTLLLGVSSRLEVRALTADGADTPIRGPVRWRSSDTAVATADSAGVVHPRARGTVRIEASLAGWRTTAGLFRVAGDSATTLLEERWDGSWRDRWIVFGEPAPEVVPGPGGTRGFWNRGDGTYQSLAVLRRGLRATSGLGVEAKISTPLGNSNWQRLRLLLVAGLDTTGYRLADQRKAPPSLGRGDTVCGTTFPAGSGRFGRGRIAFTGSIAQTLDAGAVGKDLGAGRWWTLRLQILPDGRCGVAIDGRVVWISPEPVPLDGEFRLRLGDESAGAKLLHGPLQVWTGVRTDIDWSLPPG